MKSAAGIANIDIKEVTKFFRGLEFPALSSTNWITWKFRVGSCLRAEGLEALLHEDPILADVPLPILERWCVKLADALIASIEDSLLLELGLVYDGAVLTPSSVWSALHSRFRVSATVRKAQLRKRLESFTLDEFADVATYSAKIISTIQELQLLGVVTSHEDQLYRFFQGLPETYSPAVSNLYLNGVENITFGDAVEHIKAYHMLCGTTIVAAAAVTPALVAPQNTTGDSRTCYNCQEVGHISRDCPQPRKERASRRMHCPVCKKSGDHRVSDCPIVQRAHKLASAAPAGSAHVASVEKKPSRFQKHANVPISDSATPESGSVKAESGSAKPESGDILGDCLVATVHVSDAIAASAASESSQSWLMDSGASRHMCNNIELFHDTAPVENPIRVRVADGNTVDCATTGSVRLTLVVGDGVVRVTTLTGVLYVPSFGRNLFSVTSALDVCHGSVHMDKTVCRVLSKDGRPLAEGFRDATSRLFALRM